jgi:hypothetical protein
LVPRGQQRATRGNCRISRRYIPSPYELQHMEFARSLMGISDSARRLDALLRFVTAPEEIRSNYRWLRYAKLLMQGSPVDNEKEAKEILSYFEVTRVCRGGAGAAVPEEWVQWIEPVTVHGRHPFAFAECRHIEPIVRYYPRRLPLERLEGVLAGGADSFPRSVAAVPIMNVDYLILLSAHMMHNLQGASPGERESSTRPRTHPRAEGTGAVSPLRPLQRHFLVDAGTSFFHSSLSWLACAYSQVPAQPEPPVNSAYSTLSE